jgi:1,4-alpha-glucan branching enzyme
VTFFCNAPAAASVSVSGDFNHWHRTAAPMRRMPDGGWVLRVTMRHGHHQYYFLVDGHPTLDPKSLGTGRNDRGEPVSLLAVS